MADSFESHSIEESQVFLEEHKWIPQDRRNPAPVHMWVIPVFTRFYRSQVGKFGFLNQKTTVWMGSRFHRSNFPLPDFVIALRYLPWSRANMRRVMRRRWNPPRAVEFTVGQCPLRLVDSVDLTKTEETWRKDLGFDVFAGWKDSHLKR